MTIARYFLSFTKWKCQDFRSARR